ncbi:SDR family NAD(P)-dependent oxidoreductase, partial [Staphylococcus aureus]
MDATSGIGQAIAKVLGQNGVNLVLVGQNQQILQRVHDNIAQCYPQLQLDLIHCNFADQQSRE